MRYTYTVEKGRQHHVDFDASWDKDDTGYIAEEAAKDYYHNYGGWKSSWPLKIEVFLGFRSLGRFLVYIRHEPSFSADELQP